MELYNSDSALFAHQDCSITINAGQTGILYWFDFNIKEVAEVIKKYGLQARIIGAADSETGTPEINERLSVERADYIAGLLKAHGVDESHIQKKYRGGIDSYEPLNGNRNTCVVLYFK